MRPLVEGLVTSTNAQGLLRLLTCTSQLRPVLEELAFRLVRVGLLLSDINRIRRLSPRLCVELLPPTTPTGHIGVRLVFSLLERHSRFSLEFPDMHYGYPYADLHWTFSHLFGPVDLTAVSAVVSRFITAPAHGLLPRLASALLAL